MMRWLTVLLLLACSKPKRETKQLASPSQCARVADHLVSLMSGAGKHPPEATDPLRRAIDDRCTNDTWSEPTMQCLLQLASLAEGERCQATMTQAQIAAFHRASEAATVELRAQFTEEAPPDAPVPPPGASTDPAANPQRHND